MRSDSEGGGTSCWSDRKPIAPASHSLTGGALRRLRQYTRGKLGATSWANLAASMVLPIPPKPKTATSRHRSSSTQRRSSANSSARPTKPVVSGASPQSWACAAVPVGRSAAPEGADVRGLLRREKASEPLFVEGGVQAWPLALDCRPQLACFRELSASGKPTRLEQCPDQRLESLGSWQRHTCFPVLHRSSTDARARGEVALDKAGATAIAQEQAAERLRWFEDPCLPPRQGITNSQRRRPSGLRGVNLVVSILRMRTAAHRSADIGRIETETASRSASA